MGKVVYSALPLGLVAVAAGAPAYLLLDRWNRLGPGLRERPWPLAVIVLAATIILARLARSVAAGRARRCAGGAAAIGLASLLSLIVTATAARAALSDPSPEVAVGSALPDITLADEQGRPAPLAALRGAPTLVVLYRGAWCPFCRSQLAAIADEARPFLAAGVRVVGVSPDPPDVAGRWRERLGLPFPLLSDQENRVSTTLCGANTHCLLLISPAGVVRWGFPSDNWRVTAPPRQVLQAAFRMRAG